MNSKEIVNKQIWEVLQDVEEEILVTNEGSPVKYKIPNIIGVGIIGPDRRKKILNKLEELGAFTFQRNYEGTRIGASDVYYLIINPSKFQEVYEYYEKLTTTATQDLGDLNQRYKNLVKEIREGNNNKDLDRAVQEPPKFYIQKEIIDEFKDKKNKYDFKKLTEFLESLNDEWLHGRAYTCSIIIRAILDHIPPLLGFNSFEEVVNNYSWAPTNRKQMKSLLEFRNEGDLSLHKIITEKVEYLEVHDLPPSNRINTLLKECVDK